MELSLFLAKLIGLYFLILSVIWITRKKQFEEAMQEVISSTSIIEFSGVFSLLMGLAIAIGHSVWVLDWRIVITLIGYIAIIKGIMRLAFPKMVQSMLTKMVRHGSVIPLAILIVLGLFLTYNGFNG